MEIRLKQASFFSGEGGFDLAAEWAGWENVFHCEINPFCQRILQYYWPNAICYGNIKETDFTIHRGRVDVITGGFPCQPYSVAGKRLGKEDDRHLWPEMLRGIWEIQPAWVVGENVRGLINWNGGLVFDEVQADLEALGYEVTPFILPACAVNAPHRRDRIWFTAYSSSYGQQRPDKLKEEHNRRIQKGMEEGYEPITLHGNGNAPYPKNDRCKRKPRRRTDWSKWRLLSGKIIEGSEFIRGGQTVTNAKCFRQSGQREYKRPIDSAQDKNGKANWPDSHYEISDFRAFPTQSPVCIGNDGIPAGLDGITISNWIKESIKAHGNAIVPQVAYQIFKVINEINKQVF
jgi:DNA (cytosine-5)-methyltransferase 1